MGLDPDVFESVGAQIATLLPPVLALCRDASARLSDYTPYAPQASRRGSDRIIVASITYATSSQVSTSATHPVARRSTTGLVSWRKFALQLFAAGLLDGIVARSYWWVT